MSSGFAGLRVRAADAYDGRHPHLYKRKLQEAQAHSRADLVKRDSTI